jgi:hypothetical protein
MSRKRNLVVTEVGLGLTLLTCLLLALGYMILSHLNEMGQALPEESRTDYAVQPANAVKEAPIQATEQPQVLAIERSDSPVPVIHTSARPEGATIGASDVDVSDDAPMLEPGGASNRR